MKIVIDYPPLFHEIDAKFRVRGKPIIYAWGPLIYNPMGIRVPLQLQAHEAVHGERQGDDIKGWWRRYIDDAAFRLAEEIPAHRVEYRVLATEAINRQHRRHLLRVTAKRLAAPVYGRMVSLPRAIKLIKEEPKAVEREEGTK